MQSTYITLQTFKCSFLPLCLQVYIGFYGADEFVNDDGEVIQEDPELLHASWKGYDHESGILHFMVAVGKYPGDTSVTQGFIGMQAFCSD